MNTVLDLSDMFKGCTNLRSVPSFDDIENEVLIHKSDKYYYCTYRNEYIYGKLFSNEEIYL